MKVKTIAGEVYVVSSAGGCTVTATTDDGQEITLCTVAAGVQKAFAAIGGEVEVSDSGAVVIPFVKAASLSIGQDGGSSSAEMTELLKSYATKTDVSSAVNQHAGDSSLHMNTQEREALTNLVQNPPHDGKDGKDGKDGADGAPGAPGADGEDGAPGADGKSAYQIWLDNGHSGSEQQFLDSLKGEKGEPGEYAAKGDKGDPGTNGKDGKNGVTFTPHLASDGTLSWTNDGSLTNPSPVNIKGDPGKGVTLPAGNNFSNPILGSLVSVSDSGYNVVIGRAAKCESGFATAVGDSAEVQGYATAVGSNATARYEGVAVGHLSTADNGSVAVGEAAKALGSSIAMGRCAYAIGDGSIALGYGAYSSEEGTLVLAVSGQYRTQLYLVAQGSELSNRCCGGKAALGFTLDKRGGAEIYKSGWIALEDLCKNTDFTPSFNSEDNS